MKAVAAKPAMANLGNMTLILLCTSVDADAVGEDGSPTVVFKRTHCRIGAGEKRKRDHAQDHHAYPLAGRARSVDALRTSHQGRGRDNDLPCRRHRRAGLSSSSASP